MRCEGFADLFCGVEDRRVFGEGERAICFLLSGFFCENTDDVGVFCYLVFEGFYGVWEVDGYEEALEFLGVELGLGFSLFCF